MLASGSDRESEGVVKVRNGMLRIGIMEGLFIGEDKLQAFLILGVM